MTKFSMLTKIMQRNSIDTNHGNAKSFLQQFNLYAIVLCRHDDESFINCMSESFNDLDEWTGENLLFFSLANPDVTTEAYKKCMHSADMVDDESYSIDEEIILYVLTQALHVPVTSLPAIILTDSLSKSQWYIFSTGVGNIAGDLSILTNMARHSNPNIEEYLNRIIKSAGRFWEMVESDMPLCEIIATIESAAATHSKDWIKSKNAFENSKTIERKLDRSRSEEAIELAILSRCLRKNPQNYTKLEYDSCNIIETLSEYLNDLDINSLYFLQVYDKLLSMYNENQLMDHSVLCSLTHKIFETEMNASILQMMRFCLGIPMPTYYKKWCDKKWYDKDDEETFKRFFNLNLCSRSKPIQYRSPGLGNVCYAFKDMYNDQNFKLRFRELCKKYGIEQTQVEELTSLWKDIVDIRNPEAHSMHMRNSAYQSLTKYTSQIFSNFLPNMLLIKKDLSD